MEKEKFLNKLGDWNILFKDFVNSPYFESLLNKLIEQTKSEEGLTPKIPQIFRAFYESPLKNLKIVIIGQDPYPQKNVADGIAFSSSNTNTIPPSLKIIFDEIQKTVYNNDEYTRDPNLERWSKQGILLLNTALTTIPGKIGEHYNLWSPFTKHILNELNKNYTDLIYVFMGGAAKNWANLISEENYKLYCYHPASAAYHGEGWESNDIFNRINDILKSQNKELITW